MFESWSTVDGGFNPGSGQIKPDKNQTIVFESWSVVDGGFNPGSCQIKPDNCNWNLLLTQH